MSPAEPGLDAGSDLIGSSGHIRYCRTDQVAIITLDRPAKLNAITDQMVRDLAEALRRFDLDDSAGAAVLAGTGRAFSTGADVGERQARTAQEMAALPSPEAWDADSSQLLTRAVHWKPVVAAVHGYVLGMAMGLAMECDLMVAADDVRFQVTETTRGLSPIRYWALLRWRCGEAAATKAALLGRYIDVAEAQRIGLVDHCVPVDDLHPSALGLAAELASLPAPAVRALVRTRRHHVRRINEDARYDTELHRLHRTPEFGAQVQAFVGRQGQEH